MPTRPVTGPIAVLLPLLLPRLVLRRVLLPLLLVLLLPLPLLLPALPAAAAEPPAPGLSGRWRLVEQRYNGGGHNFAEGGPASWLVVAPDGSATVETAAWRAAWPAWAGPDGPAPLSSSRVLAAGPARLDAEYRVAPAPGDDTELAVRETCTPADGDRLSCVLAVRFAPPGREAGGFTWTRVYAREGDR